MVGIHQFFMILVVLHMAMICLQKNVNLKLSISRDFRRVLVRKIKISQKSEKRV